MGFVRDYGVGYLGAFAGLALVLVVGSALMPQAGSQAGASIPDDRIVAQLQVVGGAYPDDLRAVMAAQLSAPDDLSKAQIAARALIDEGRKRGDSRLVGAAVGILRPFLANPTSDTLYLAATARQYQHDFVGALDMLDQALVLSPSDLNAQLSRATIHTVRGDYDAARQDCQRITAQNRPDIGFLCAATTEVLTSTGPDYATRLQAILAQPGLLDPQLHGWAMGLVAEIALHSGDGKLAKAQLVAVLADDPLALRERVMLADMLLAEAKPKDALDILASVPETDGVLIRRILAARAMGDKAEDARLVDVLDKRFKLNLDLGLTAHAREEALFFLKVVGDPAQALERAKVNWALQHEIDDVVLLLDAANAAGLPTAAQPAWDWIAKYKVLPPVR